MNALFARALAASLRLAQRRSPRAVCDDPRILIIRRNRMGDMICTLPLIRALRRHYPKARVTIACDAAGVPIAQACSAIDHVIPLERGWYLWTMPLQRPHEWQDFDWVIAAKAGFDRRLAALARLSNAARRIGFGDASRRISTPIRFRSRPTCGACTRSKPRFSCSPLSASLRRTIRRRPEA